LSANEPLVERMGPGRWLLRWDDVLLGSRAPVYYGSSPDAIDRSRPIAEMNGPELSVEYQTNGARPFFEIVPPGGPPRIASERLVRLEGAHNFRDLGGYATSDGRSVRWGMLYRSDDLADLNDADVATFRDLGIRWLCDFRSESERKADVDRLPTTGAPSVENLTIATGNLGSLRERILSGADEDYAQPLIEANREFATRFAHRYQTLFDRLANPQNLPALIHCTAGKDRTGLAAALVLIALGVPRETVFQDYLLTNYYAHEHIERTLLFIRFASFFRADPESVRPLLGVRREYLQAAFDAIRADYGSIERYLREGLDVSEAERAQLRASLLR
jgi:protein-tyrosine phosphatase